MAIDRLGSIQIEALRPDELVEWYRQVLGISLSMEHEGGFYGAFDFGLHFAIVPTQSPFQFAKNMVLTFHVSDFAADIERIKASGIEPSDVTDTGEGRFAFFTDPEGNRVGIWG